MRITITTTGDATVTVTTIDVDRDVELQVDDAPVEDVSIEHMADGFLPPLDAKEARR